MRIMVTIASFLTIALPHVSFAERVATVPLVPKLQLSTNVLVCSKYSALRYLFSIRVREGLEEADAIQRVNRENDGKVVCAIKSGVKNPRFIDMWKLEDMILHEVAVDVEGEKKKWYTVIIEEVR